MGPRKKMITALAFAVVTITLPMRAQHNEPFNISLAGGIGFPLGDFDDGFKLGWHGLAAASYMLPNASVGFQVEVAFSRFHDDQPASNPKNNLLYGAGNMVYQIELPGTRTVSPYLIGGAGLYYIEPTGRDGAGLHEAFQHLISPPLYRTMSWKALIEPQ